MNLNLKSQNLLRFFDRDFLKKKEENISQSSWTNFDASL